MQYGDGTWSGPPYEVVQLLIVRATHERPEFLAVAQGVGGRRGRKRRRAAERRLFVEWDRMRARMVAHYEAHPDDIPF